MPLPGNSLKGVATTEVSLCSYPYIPLLHSPYNPYNLLSHSPQVFQHCVLPFYRGVFHSHPQHPLHSYKSCHFTSSQCLLVTKPDKAAAFDHLHHFTIHPLTFNRYSNFFYTHFHCFHHPSYSDHKHLSYHSSPLPGS